MKTLNLLVVSANLAATVSVLHAVPSDSVEAREIVSQHVELFTAFGHSAEDAHMLAAVVLGDIRTVETMVRAGHRPAEQTYERLARARRTGDRIGQRVAVLYANVVAGDSWRPDAPAITPAMQALLDCRDLQCA